MNIKYIGALMSILLSLSLQAKDKALVIDMTKAKVGDIPLSKFVSKLEYIPFVERALYFFNRSIYYNH